MPADPLAVENPPLSGWDFDSVEHAYRSYTAFLTSLFSNLAGTPLQEWTYSDDPVATKINIGGTIPTDASVVAARPTIVVDYQSVDPLVQTIGDVDKVDMATGRITYLQRTDSTLAVYVISKNKTEASRIATFTREMTWSLQRTLISNGGFYLIGRGIRQGPPLPPGSLVSGGDGRSPLYAAPLAVPYSFLKSISVEPINRPKLNHMRMYIRPGTSVPPVSTPPVNWTVEEWIARCNRSRNYVPPADPASIPPPLPTAATAGGQSGSQVVAEIDLLK